MSTRKLKEDLTFLSEDDFFNTLAERCNYINTDLVKEVYYELIKLTTQQLRKQGSIRYPVFGDFILKYKKPRELISVHNGQRMTIPMRKVVKFTPSPKLRKYFVSLS